ncbi:MAG: histidine phosphatase family protein [Phycisphaerales bacterium]|nr:histidine phosphatase family protein [Phycisphaerales bacterium]
MFQPMRMFPMILCVALTATTSCQTLETATFSLPGTTTTIILVRHCERDPGLDPPLNAEGLVRRIALLNTLSENGVTAIYASDLLRNRQSVELLETELGIAATLIGALDLADTKALANRLVDEWLRDHAGGVVLWCGNTGPVIQDVQGGNMEEIYRRLGGTGRAPNRYQDLYIVVVSETGDARFIKTEYGGTSSLD